MPANTTITCQPNTWTLLTANDVQSLRLQNVSPFNCHVTATADTTPPVGTPEAVGAMVFLPFAAVGAGDTLVEMFPGIPNAARVWARFESGGQVAVSHA